jgi:hypothetical protein
VLPAHAPVFAFDVVEPLLIPDQACDNLSPGQRRRPASATGCRSSLLTLSTHCLKLLLCP